MKKLMLLLTMACAIMSCTKEELEECDFRKQTIDNKTASISYVSDELTQRILYGTWQCSENFTVDNLEVTEITFQHRDSAYLLVNEKYSTERYYIQVPYQLTHGRLRIRNITYSTRFTYPTLYLFGIHGVQYEITKRS